MNSLEVLIDHALATLPDSISARKRLLRASVNVMKSNHPQYKTAVATLFTLEKHEAQQAKLPLKSGLLRRSDGDGDGDGDGHRKKSDGDGDGDGDGKGGGK